MCGAIGYSVRNGMDRPSPRERRGATAHHGGNAFEVFSIFIAADTTVLYLSRS